MAGREEEGKREEKERGEKEEGREYIRQINAPPKCLRPIPKTSDYVTLHGKRDFADVITVISL